jgi:DNA-binding NtrC family response regulator
MIMQQHVDTDGAKGSNDRETPGLVVVFNQQAAVVPVPLDDDGTLEVGRELLASYHLRDMRISGRHFRVAFKDGFSVTDLGSRNGTFVDGVPVKRGTPREVTRIIRAGDTLFLPVRDAARMIGSVAVVDGRVVGAAQRASFKNAELAAGLGKTAQIIGERGTGKEALARAYHAAGPAPDGPFHVARCAAMPEGAIDQVLFGAGAGPQGGGYIRAARGGTLFVYGVAELPEAVQAKLLHLLAHGELPPLGGGQPEKLDVRLAFATRRELRADVEARTLREDLYYRLAAPRVYMPSLRERPEEIAFLLEEETKRVAPGLSMDASLVETALLRSWPGNVRELQAEARNAAQAARVAGVPSIDSRFLDPMAGVAFGAAQPPPAQPPRDSHTRVRAAVAEPAGPTRERVKAALAHHGGNVSAAARALGVHRTQLRRVLDRYGVDPRTFVSEDDTEG